MRISRVAPVVALMLTLGAVGCSKSDPAPANTAAGGVTTTAKPADIDLSTVSTIALTDCVTVTGGNLDILVAKDAAQSKKAGEDLKAGKPPAAIAAEIDVLVGLKGDVVAITSGPGKAAKANVDAWVAKVCPKK